MRRIHNVLLNSTSVDAGAIFLYSHISMAHASQLLPNFTKKLQKLITLYLLSRMKYLISNNQHKRTCNSFSISLIKKDSFLLFSSYLDS